MSLSDTEADVYRKMILAALEHYVQPGPITINDVFYGPRHNELGFRASNGDEIVVTVTKRNWR